MCIAPVKFILIGTQKTEGRVVMSLSKKLFEIVRGIEALIMLNISDASSPENESKEHVKHLPVAQACKLTRFCIAFRSSEMRTRGRDKE